VAPLLQRQEAIWIEGRGSGSGCATNTRSASGSRNQGLRVPFRQPLAYRPLEETLAQEEAEGDVTKGVRQHPFQPVESMAPRSVVSAVTKCLDYAHDFIGAV
jgi:hypothetical protein